MAAGEIWTFAIGAHFKMQTHPLLFIDINSTVIAHDGKSKFPASLLGGSP